MAAQPLAHAASTETDRHATIDEGEGREGSAAAMARVVGDALSGAAATVSGLLIVASVVLVAVGVYMRYVVNRDLTSGDDLQTLFFDWIIFLGIPRALWQDTSPKVGVGRRIGIRYPAGGVALAGAQAVLELGLLGYALISALRLLPTSATTTISTLGISESWSTMSVVVGAALSIVVVLARSIRRGWALALIPGVVVGGILAGVLLMTHLSPYAAAAVGIGGGLILDLPVAVALGLGGAAMVVGGQMSQLPTFTSQLLSGPENLSLLAIPLFMLMGGVIAQSRLAVDLSRFVRALFGWLPGGLGVASIATAGVFANMSGSAVADSAAIATVFTPQLKASGYEPEEAAALLASAGVVGVVFPPAIAMILYGTVANVDIVQVFKAVIIPGLMLVVFMMAMTIAKAHRRVTSSRTTFRWGELLRSTPRALPVLLIPVILDGGIFSGIFTPAESGAVAVVVASVLVTALGGMRLGQARAALSQAVDTTTLVMFILVMVTVLDYGFTTSGVQGKITSLLSLAGHNKLLFLIIVNVIFLAVHELVETAPSILVLVPLIIPASLAVGVNPYQLGAVIAINSTIGLVLPPVGVSLYVTSRIAQVDPMVALKRAWPYIGTSLLCLVLVTAIPSLSTWLPAHW